jgi:hypothetical protein
MLKAPWLFAAILVVQSLCAFFFVSDILLSVLGVPFGPIPWVYREVMEIGAAVGLVLGVVLGAILLRASLRRTRDAERASCARPRAPSWNFWKSGSTNGA